MRYFKIFVILLLPFGVFSQTPVPVNVLTDDIEKLLPPLKTIIDSAVAHDGFVKYRQKQIELSTYRYKFEKMKFLQNTGLQTTYGIGNFNYLNTDYLNGQLVNTVSEQSTISYQVGAFLRLPLSELFNRKNMMKQSRIEIDAAKDMVEVQTTDVRQKVIRQYNDLILSQRILKIKSKNLTTSRINLQMVEKEFSNGVINLTELARYSQITSDAETLFERARMDFQTAYMILEDIAGYTFNLNYQIPGNDEDN
jgi:outer membrane protein TolC